MRLRKLRQDRITIKPLGMCMPPPNACALWKLRTLPHYTCDIYVPFLKHVPATKLQISARRRPASVSLLAVVLNRYIEKVFALCYVTSFDEVHSSPKSRILLRGFPGVA